MRWHEVLSILHALTALKNSGYMTNPLPCQSGSARPTEWCFTSLLRYVALWSFLAGILYYSFLCIMPYTATTVYWIQSNQANCSTLKYWQHRTRQMRGQNSNKAIKSILLPCEPINFASLRTFKKANNTDVQQILPWCFAKKASIFAEGRSIASWNAFICKSANRVYTE